MPGGEGKEGERGGNTGKTQGGGNEGARDGGWVGGWVGVYAHASHTQTHDTFNMLLTIHQFKLGAGHR